MVSSKSVTVAATLSCKSNLMNPQLRFLCRTIQKSVSGHFNLLFVSPAFQESELVTIGLLSAVKGVGQQALYRWLRQDYGHWFPALPERTRLFRRLKTHWAWAQMFLEKPSLLGVIDSYGVELVHPVRRGRNPKGWAEPGISNHRRSSAASCARPSITPARSPAGPGPPRTPATPGSIRWSGRSRTGA